MAMAPVLDTEAADRPEDGAGVPVGNRYALRLVPGADAHEGPQDGSHKRASRPLVESYLLGEFAKSNPGKSKVEKFKKPLTIQYGSYAVRKGNRSFVHHLNRWICKIQKSGFMAKAYRQTESAPLPPMPKC